MENEVRWHTSILGGQWQMCIRDSLYTELDERARSDSEIPGMSTGFHALDTALTGLNKSDLILIAARPGMGKTAFALNVALNAAKASVKNKERGDKKGTGAVSYTHLLKRRTAQVRPRQVYLRDRKRRAGQAGRAQVLRSAGGARD